jgi:hypothetical protein
MLRVLQRAGALVLETGTGYQSKGIFTMSAPAAKPVNGGPSGGETNGGNSQNDTDGGALPEKGNPPGDVAKSGTLKPDTGAFQPTPEEVMSAEKDGYEWRNISKGIWELRKKEPQPKFYLKPTAKFSAKQIILGSGIVDPNNPEHVKAVDNLIYLLEKGFTVKTEAREHTSSETCLILRSFDRVLEATASEQEAFAAILAHQNDPDYNKNFYRYLPYGSPECRPILKTRWNDEKGPLERPLCKLNYAGKTYEITDPVQPIDLAQPGAAAFLDDSGRWNRNVYKLVMALNSQVTVDISKFQRQILELQQ